jgi:hypothetical protein
VPTFDHYICCFLAKRRLITRLTVDSTKAVEIRSGASGDWGCRLQQLLKAEAQPCSEMDGTVGNFVLGGVILKQKETLNGPTQRSCYSRRDP